MKILWCIVAATYSVMAILERDSQEALLLLLVGLVCLVLVKVER